MKLLRLTAALLLAMSIPAMAQVTAPAPYLATALTNSVQTIKASRGALRWLSCYNPNPVAYVQLFDAASATPGTTAAKLSIGLNATAQTSVPADAQFTTAIKAAATTTATGATATSSAVVCNFGFN